MLYRYIQIFLRYFRKLLWTVVAIITFPSEVFLVCSMQDCHLSVYIISVNLVVFNVSYILPIFFRTFG